MEISEWCYTGSLTGRKLFIMANQTVRLPREIQLYANTETRLNKIELYMRSNKLQYNSN